MFGHTFFSFLFIVNKILRKKLIAKKYFAKKILIEYLLDTNNTGILKKPDSTLQKNKPKSKTGYATEIKQYID